MDAKLAAIASVYGPTANIYLDVLKVSPTATTAEIREAFFCLRYDIYQKLEVNPNVNASGGSSSASGRDGMASELTSDERKKVEQKMEAVTGAFHILSDVGRRKVYDDSLALASAAMAGSNDGSDNDGGTDSRGFHTPSPRGVSSAAARRMARSANANINAAGNNNNSPSSPAKLSPSKSDNRQRGTYTRRSREVGQRRSVFRRRGMNESRRAVAKIETGGLNSRVSPMKKLVVETEEDVNEDDVDIPSSGKKSPRWTADFKKDDNKGGARDGYSQQDANQPLNNAQAGGFEDEDPSYLPGGVSSQEEMLHKNQMYNTPTAGSNSRLGSRYKINARGDKYAHTEDDGDGVESPLISPTGVDDFESGWSSKAKHDNSNKGHTNSHTNNQRQSTTTTDSNITDDELYRAGAGTASVTSKTVEDEDESMYDDDTRTYDDATSCADDTTTLGETIDESTWTSYEDDATSYTAQSKMDEYEVMDEKDGGKYSPKHKKKGNNPKPILKSGLNKGTKRSDSENRRVTIHSHRGRGEDTEEDFSLFEGVGCPTIPSLNAIREEMNGTYKDFTQALHQVTNAFVISPDDIDRLADKIRDAKIKLGENYTRQVKDRQKSGTGVGGEGEPHQGQQRRSSSQGGQHKSRRTVKKTLSA